MYVARGLLCNPRERERAAYLKYFSDLPVEGARLDLIDAREAGAAPKVSPRSSLTDQPLTRHGGPLAKLSIKRERERERKEELL